MNDLISRQAAIEAMSEALKRVFPEHRQIAEKCLNALPSAQPEQQWLPVSERLPEDGQEVQITYDAKRKTEKYRVWSAIWDELHGRFYDKEYRSYISLDYVTAWMPLPEPYKAESEEV